MEILNTIVGTESNSVITINTSQDYYKKKLNFAKEKFHPKIAFECVGGELTASILNTIEEEGILYHYGNLSLRNIGNVVTNDLLFLDKKICGFWLFKYLSNIHHKNKIYSEFEQILKNEPDLIETNINDTFTPDKFEDALKKYKNEMTLGKILLDFR